MTFSGRAFIVSGNGGAASCGHAEMIRETKPHEMYRDVGVSASRQANISRLCERYARARGNRQSKVETSRTIRAREALGNHIQFHLTLRSQAKDDE